MHPNIPNAYTIILSLTFFQYSQFLTSSLPKTAGHFSHTDLFPCFLLETTMQNGLPNQLPQVYSSLPNATWWSPFLTNTMFPFWNLSFFPYAIHNAHTPHLAQYIMYHCFHHNTSFHHPLCTIHW